MPEPGFTMERYGKLHETDRSFDIEYWQRLGHEAIFEASWQMVVDFYSGQEHLLNLDRSLEAFRPLNFHDNQHSST